MRLKKTINLGRLLVVLAGSGAPAAAFANCQNTLTQGCDEGYVFDSRSLQETMLPWLSFAVDPQTQQLGYQADVAARSLNFSDALSFEFSGGPEYEATRFRDSDRMNVTSGTEPAFALLFGKVARLRADGTVALGRGDDRSNSAERRPSQWDGLLPAAFYSWDDRLDVDLGLSYAGQTRFSTSVGFAESIGNQNNDPAVVGWFEYRF